MPDSFKKFIDAWTQPAVLISLVLSIFYSIVWIVKLDDRVDALTKAQERATSIQEEHLKEAEIWKRKILLNERNTQN